MSMVLTPHSTPLSGTMFSLKRSTMVVHWALVSFFRGLLISLSIVSWGLMFLLSIVSSSPATCDVSSTHRVVLTTNDRNRYLANILLLPPIYTVSHLESIHSYSSFSLSPLKYLFTFRTTDNINNCPLVSFLQRKTTSRNVWGQSGTLSDPFSRHHCLDEKRNRYLAKIPLHYHIYC